MNVQDAVSSRFLFGKDVELPEDKWKIGARTLEKTMRAGNGVSKTCFEKNDL